MARADSTVRVNIIGDASKLNGALRQGESGVGRFQDKLKGVAIGVGAAFSATAVVGFVNESLAEFDRLGDATTRLEQQLGDLSGPLIDSAGSFARLGGSTQDVLELEAAFADLGTAAELSDPVIASWADRVAEAGLALALLTDMDAAQVVDLIGKAAGGSERPLRDLGINMSAAEVEARALAETGKSLASELTESELAAARMSIIMEQLDGRIRAVTEGSGDLEQSQAELQARIETLQGKVGEAVEGPLNDFLGWILAGIDGLERLDEFFVVLFDHFEGVQTPLGELNDLLATFIVRLQQALKLIPGLGLVVPNLPRGGSSGGFGPTPPGGGAPGGNVTIQVQGGSPEEIQQAVYQAYYKLKAYQAIE